VFESLITTYNVPGSNLDVEADSLTNTADQPPQRGDSR